MFVFQYISMYCLFSTLSALKVIPMSIITGTQIDIAAGKPVGFATIALIGKKIGKPIPIEHGIGEIIARCATLGEVKVFGQAAPMAEQVERLVIYSRWSTSSSFVLYIRPMGISSFLIRI